MTVTFGYGCGTDGMMVPHQKLQGARGSLEVALRYRPNRNSPARLAIALASGSGKQWRKAVGNCASRDRRFCFGGFLRRLRVDNRILETEQDRTRLATFARRWLRVASHTPATAGHDAGYEVIVVAVHGRTLWEPAGGRPGFAEQAFDPAFDEDALARWFLRRRADHSEMARRPDARIDVEAAETPIMTAEVSSPRRADNQPASGSRQPDSASRTTWGCVPGQHIGPAATLLRTCRRTIPRPARILCACPPIA